ncbi:MAG TPA: hypothetical protein VMT62_06980 [Syntrophorhabdaceae bacterium]|nr:hypothetical protein [Syntrophorhabdaceae bacterium]
MQLKHVPRFGTKYWTALILASIFGANTGDFLSDVMKLGHIAGLPFLAVLFALVIIVERFDSSEHTAYFWSAIVIIRTSATNIGDIGHDLHLRAPLTLSAFAIALFITVLSWQASARANKPKTGQGSTAISTVPVYWFAMLLAGALGTVLGDYFSFGLKLGTLRSTLTLSIPLALALSFGGTLLRTQLLYYFLTVVLIRAAGTAAGDFAAHTIGLKLSTLVSGIVFVATLALWRQEARSESETELSGT